PGWDKVDVSERLKPPQWESEILAAGYVFAYFDGLNRFYVRGDLAHLAKRLSLPPGVFDFVTNAAVRAMENIAQEKERVITELSAALRKREAEPALRAHQLAGDFVAFLRSIGATLRARARLKPRLGVLRQYPPRPLVQTHKFTRFRAQDAPRISLVTPSFQQGA